MDPEITSDVKRTHGFAYGDRVGITEGKWAGACGKVEFSSAGCMDDCRDHCHLISVQLTHLPAGIEKAYPSELPAFKVKQVTHID
jgi:hypothetical protein